MVWFGNRNIFELGRRRLDIAAIERVPHPPDGKPRPFNLGFSLNLWMSIWAIQTTPRGFRKTGQCLGLLAFQW